MLNSSMVEPTTVNRVVVGSSPTWAVYKINKKQIKKKAGVMELADIQDLKSWGRKFVRVQVSSPALIMWYTEISVYHIFFRLIIF